MGVLNGEELSKLQTSVFLRHKLEKQALASQTSETLSSLNISIDGLPLKCQQLLHRTAQLQTTLDVETIDPLASFHKHSGLLNSQLELEYNLLELRQKNEDLRREVERNNMFIEGLRKELRDVKESLNCQNPNPDNLQEHMRETKQKLASYEEVYEKAKAKFTKLSVPDAVLPSELEALAARLEALRGEEGVLRQRADDVTLARAARDTLRKLRL